MVWLLGIVIVVFLLLRKYTFGKWTKDNPNPYVKQTLGIPGGVFRGLLTLTLLFVVILFETVNIKDPGFEARTHMLLSAFQMMIAFYFGSKVMHHITSVDIKKTQANANAQVEQKRYDADHLQMHTEEQPQYGMADEDETSVG